MRYSKHISTGKVITEMDMLSVTGFFSYAHEDDYNNVLTQLQNDLRHAYKVLTGQDLVLFSTGAILNGVKNGKRA